MLPLCLAVAFAPSGAWAASEKGNPVMTLNDRGASRADRIKAAKALATSKDPHAIDALLMEIMITDEDIAAAVKNSLRALKPAAVLEKRLEDSSAADWQKVLACRGLRVVGERSSVGVLVGVLKNGKQSREVREAAVSSLSAFASTDADAEAALVAALSDSEPPVRSAVAYALSRVRTPAVKRAIEDRIAVEKDATVSDALDVAKGRLEQAPSPATR